MYPMETGASYRLAVLLHADVADSTGLVQRDERLAHGRIRSAFLTFTEAIRRYGGTVHEVRGDALVAEFSRASDAVLAALSAQAANRAANAALEDAIVPEIRVGIALGEVVVADGTVTGAGIVLAQRLEQLAARGGLCVSAAVREAVPARLPLKVEDLGPRKAKGFPDPIRAYAVTLAVDAELPAPEPSSVRVSPRRGRFGLAAAAAALLVAVAVLIRLLAGPGQWDDPGPAPALPDKPSVAVLPFDNLSDDAGKDYFADGLTDDLITDLSKISGLFVIARNSSFSYKGQVVPTETVARQLGVRYVIEGSVRRAGNRVRVNAQLVDGASGHPIWAERYDRELVDLFATQDDLVARIVSALTVRLTEADAAKLGPRPVPAFEAYDLFLQARSDHMSHDQDRIQRALGLYERAWAADPTFARPYGGYARLATDIWRLGSIRGALGATGALARATAEAAAEKALSIDPALPEAHSALALMLMKDGAHEAAVNAARRAVESDPNSADAHTVLAVVEGFAGRGQAALNAIRTAVRLNPRPPPYLAAYHGWVLFINRRYEEAIAVLEPVAEARDRGLQESPREFLAMAYAQAGRQEEARVLVRSLLSSEPFLNLAYYRLAYDHLARPEDLEHHIEVLRMAGMPAWPLAFRGDPALRLDAAELGELVRGKTWRGTDATRELEFIQQFSDRGETVYASTTTFLTGSARIEDDELCESFDGFLWGRKLCGAVYRQDGGAAGREYVYVNPPTVKYFSIQ